MTLHTIGKFIAAAAAAMCACLSVQAEDTVYNRMDGQGRRQGYWKKSHPNGKTAYTAFFVNNRIRGDMVRYHDNGNRMAVIHYYDGNEPCLARLYSTEGRQIAEGHYITDGVKYGKWDYFDNGKLIRQENYNSSGKLDGEQLNFYPSGKVFERSRFAGGLQTGLYEQIDEKGTPVVEMMYSEGKPNGKVRYYYNNYQVRIEGQHKQGARVGEWAFYDINGKVERRTEYVNGIASDQELVDEALSDVLKQLDKNKGAYKEPEERLKGWQGL